MGTAKTKIIACLLLALALIGGGVGIAVHRLSAQEAPGQEAIQRASPREGDGAATPVLQVGTEQGQRAEIDALRRDLQKALRELEDLRRSLRTAPVPPPVKLFRGKPIAFWIEQVQDYDPNYRAEAVKVLGIIASQDEKSVIPVLAEAMKDKNPKVGTEARKGLTSAGAAALPALISLVNEEDTLLRTQAMRALGAIRPPAKTAVPRLIQALHDNDAQVVRAAADALRGIGPDAKAALPALLEALQRHLKDSDPGTRDSTAFAITSIDPATQKLFPARFQPSSFFPPGMMGPGMMGPGMRPPGGGGEVGSQSDSSEDWEKTLRELKTYKLKR